MSFIEWIKQPWPWYVAGPLIGLTVPTLLIIGNNLLASVHPCGMYVLHVYLPTFLFLNTTGKKKPGIYFLLQVFFLAEW